MAHADLQHSLGLAAERYGDVFSERVFEAFCSARPDARQILTATDARTRARMFESLIELIAAVAVDEQAEYVRFEVANHRAYGVRKPMYESLMGALLSSIRHACADQWTSAMEEAWESQIADVRRLIDKALVP